jgi:hypothetical protein
VCLLRPLALVRNACVAVSPATCWVGCGGLVLACKQGHEFIAQTFGNMTKVKHGWQIDMCVAPVGRCLPFPPLPSARPRARAAPAFPSVRHRCFVSFLQVCRLQRRDSHTVCKH